MRLILLAGAFVLTSSCSSMLKDMHTERALDECEETYRNADEIIACQNREREARYQRDKQTEYEAQKDE